MSRRDWPKNLLVAVGGLGLFVSCLLLGRAQDLGPAAQPAEQNQSIELAQKDAVQKALSTARETAKAFVEAFNAGDAKAVASLWTLGGTYTEADGIQLVGRDEIEQEYAEFFRTNPGARIDVNVERVQVLGPNVVIEEGTSRLVRPGEENESKETAAARYSVLHVRVADGWKMGSVTEWPSDPSLAVSLDDVAWLIGDWEIDSDGAAAHVNYEWEEGRAFIRGRYTVRRGDEIESSGSEMITRNPEGGLRSWRFENNGAFAESLWARDGKTWLIETSGKISEGSDVSAVVLLTPLDNDSFLWQSTARMVGGVELPGTRPLKVKRVPSSPANKSSSPR